MADTGDKDSKEKSTTASTVANLSVPTIISALHQKAVSSAKADTKGAKVINSAVDDDSNKKAIKFAGEHIIGIVPLESGTTVKKSDAIDILKVYVQWFVGPDLASKINDSTVKPLTESPIEESRAFMPFDKFLLLEEGEDAPESSEEGSNSKEDGKSDDGKDSDSKDGSHDGEGQDESTESKLGYYIPYSLKVEGLPQTALKDSMKKFAKTFFDDVKITASGLFGGGDSFTVGDVKKALRSAFGPIDPDDLVQQVQTRIDKLYKGSGHPLVNIQDKDTLTSDLGKQIDASQRKAISGADYSLFIKVDEHDPKKPIFNPRIVADIVQSSITGIFKKFKNKITKNDVIYIRNYQDTHENAEKIKALYNKVPIPDDIVKIINKAGDANKAYSEIEKIMNKIATDDQRDNCKRAIKCVASWEEFKNSVSSDDAKARTSIPRNKVMQYFEPFVNEYTKAFKSTKDTSIDHAINENALSPIVINKRVLAHLIESILQEKGEEESSSGFDAKQIKDEVVKALKSFHFSRFTSDNAIVVGTRSDISSALKSGYYTFDENVVFGAAPDGFNNGILAIENAGASSLSESFAGTDAIKSRIMSILFEDDVDSSKSSPSSSKDTASKLSSIFKKVLDRIGIEDYADNAFVVEKETIDESVQLVESDKLDIAKRVFADKMIDIAKGGKEKIQSVHPLATVGSPDAVKEWLDKYGLVDASLDSKFSKFNGAAALILKIATEIDGKTRGASIGFKHFNDDNVASALQNSVEGIDGKPELTSYKKTANNNLLYNKSNIPANCQVRVMFFNVKEDGKPEDTKPESSKDDVAYVFPFGKEDVHSSSGSDGTSKDDVDIDAHGKYDAYVIPMKGLAYEDPEHANTNIK